MLYLPSAVRYCAGLMTAIVASPSIGQYNLAPVRDTDSRQILLAPVMLAVPVPVAVDITLGVLLLPVGNSHGQKQQHDEHT